MKCKLSFNLREESLFLAFKIVHLGLICIKKWMFSGIYWNALRYGFTENMRGGEKGQAVLL